MRAFILIFTLFSFFSGRSNAYCDKPQFHIFFANGMFNSKRAALNSLRELRNSLPREQSDDYSILANQDYLAYNTNEDILNQLFEVARQKSKDAEISFWKYLSKTDEAPNWFKTIESEIEKSIVFDEVSKNSDLRKQINKYRQILSSPQNHVVTIAHSQGNMFTNFAFATLAQDFSIKNRLNMISVATPAGQVFNHGPHTNLSSDCVVAKIPGALLPNVKNQESGLYDHAFVENYLRGDESGAKIRSDIANAVQLTAKDFPASHQLSIDFKYFLRWKEQFDRLGIDKKMEPHQCFAMRLSLMNLFWQNIECNSRGMIGIEKGIKHCLQIKSHEKITENLCPTYFGKEPNDMNEMRGQLFSESKSSNNFSKHVECSWSEEDFYKKILTDELKIKTLNFMKDPWSEIPIDL